MSVTDPFILNLYNMKILLLCLCFTYTAHAQFNYPEEQKWKIDKNKLITGGLAFTAGAAKGFNETLLFHWDAFHHTFPNANPKWFNPDVSWRNKYKNGNCEEGPRYPLSTSVLVM